MLEELGHEITAKSELVEAVRREMARVVVGQKALVDRMLIGLLSKGHILLEGVPGLAKTTAVKALAGTMQAEFKRIQFTPDLLPADIVGTEIYEPKTGEFSIKKGPLYNNIILADEVNRAPSKVQSALLEAMQERQITIGGETFRLPDPFLVMATQNPIEQEGTYPLPEAQVDRFMLKVTVDYPDHDEEKEIVNRYGHAESIATQPVLAPQDLEAMHQLVAQIHLDEKLLDYIINLVRATRNPEAAGALSLARFVEYGASPRAAIYLAMAARAYAFLHGRPFVTPQDIKTIAFDVLRHRIILSYEAEAEDVSTEAVVERLFDSVEVP